MNYSITETVRYTLRVSRDISIGELYEVLRKIPYHFQLDDIIETAEQDAGVWFLEFINQRNRS